MISAWWLLPAFLAGALCTYAALYIAANLENPQSWWGNR